MITCPWCGTGTGSSQTTCQTCGGRIADLSEKPGSGEISAGIEAILSKPPPAPRPFAANYAWRLLLTDGWAITALVLGILGAIFAILAAPMALAATTRPIAFCFAPMGLLFLGAAAALVFWRLQRAKKRVEVLRSGAAVEGKIVRTEQIKTVRVNRRHPWAIDYAFKVKGQPHTGQVRTFNTPGDLHQPGKHILVLYLPDSPEWNTLYPHP